MRSELVFTANDAVSNRYLLCRIVSMSTRKFHGIEASVHETINTVLEKVGARTVQQMISPALESEPIDRESSLPLTTDLDFGL